MPVPWEALIPFALVTTMFGAAGTLFGGASRITNQGKPPRYGIDNWDEMMMERDERLTGHNRGQSVNVRAPAEFATNSIWHAQRPRTS
ncbi:small secreted protein [Auriculariales sp. MPI-PUGE-AT-0066]|nr:small secreted protein [Auriculariales sp. MPI-PUGE-AT-0066]